MHCRISPRRMCNPCGYTMKISSRYHRILIYDVKRNIKIDGIGPFKVTAGFSHWVKLFDLYSTFSLILQRKDPVPAKCWYNS